MNKDRIKKYLKKYLDGFLFAPLQMAEVSELSPLAPLKGADIPFREGDVEEFQKTGALSHAKLTENIVYLLGIDPDFTWNTRYRAYLLSFWGRERILKGIIDTGQELGRNGDFERACIFFRAALVLCGRFSESGLKPANSTSEVGGSKADYNGAAGNKATLHEADSKKTSVSKASGNKDADPLATDDGGTMAIAAGTNGSRNDESAKADGKAEEYENLLYTALYQYAHACRQNYLNANAEVDGDEYIGDFKAEALDFFERATLIRPDFADAHYYLGYAYVNLGLYTKAKLEWEAFIDTAKASSEWQAAQGAVPSEARDAERSEAEGKPPLKGEGDREAAPGLNDPEINDMLLEIKARLSEIKSPVEIEQAVNDIARGEFAKGLNVLEPYAAGDTSYSRWWPMYFYMGIACEALGYYEKAIENFKKVLGLNASHRESMEELSKLYTITGDHKSAEKYTKKLELLSTTIG